jgi:hypothetical protein
MQKARIEWLVPQSILAQKKLITYLFTMKYKSY